MGCATSKSDVYEADDDAEKTHQTQQAQVNPSTAATNGSRPETVHLSPDIMAALATANMSNLSHASGVITLGENKTSNTSNFTRISPSALAARACSRSGFPKNSVGADLHSIMDDQGMLNPLVSRQMSVMSHYSVRSESGSVMITPESRAGGAPFKLLKLIGRGGFGNVYLGEWEDGERVAVKIIQVGAAAAGAGVGPRAQMTCMPRSCPSVPLMAAA